MPPKKSLPLIALLAFAWLFLAAAREHLALGEARQDLGQAAALLGTSDGGAGNVASRLRLLAESFDFQRLSILNPDQSSFAEANLPALIVPAERPLFDFKFIRPVSLEASLPHSAKRLRGIWINRCAYGHVLWLLAFVVLGWWLWLLLQQLSRERRDVVGRLDAERDLRLRSEEELGNRLFFSRMLVEISAELSGLGQQEMEEGFRRELGRLGTYMEADRAFVFMIEPQDDRFSFCYGWEAARFPEPPLESLKSLPPDAFPWWIEKIKSGETIHLPGPASFPEAASSEKYLLGLHGIYSTLAVPVVAGTKVIGFLGISRSYQSSGWAEGGQVLIRNAGQMLGSVMERRRQNETLSQLLKRERLLSAISSAFLLQGGPALDMAVELALEKLARHATAARAGVFQIHGDGERLSASHEWNAPGTTPMKARSKDINFSGLPSLKQRMLKGEFWAVQGLSRLNSDAAAEVLEWQRREMLSFLAMPLLYQGHSLGFLLLERSGDSQAWTEDELDCARQAAPLLAGLFARQRGEMALQRSEARNRSLVEAVPDLMLRLNESGELLDLRQPRGILAELDYVPGQPLESLERQGQMPFSHLGLAARIRAGMVEKLNQSFDWEASSGQGKRWYEVRVLPAPGETLVLIRDIQDEKNRELENEKLRGHLLAVFNAGKQSFVLIDREMKVEAFNDNAVLGTKMMYGKEIFLGASFLDFMPPGQTQNFMAAFDRCLKGEAISHKREVQNHEGAKQRFQIQYLPVFDDEGGVRSVCCSYESLGDLQQAEMALQESEERYALASRGSNDGLWDWNLVTGRMFFSQRWCSMLGLDEPAAPKNLEEWLALVGEDDREVFRSKLQAHLSGQTAHFEVELRMRGQAGGEPIWVQCRGLAVRELNGKATRIAGSQTDIEARRRADARQKISSLSDPLTGLPNRALLADRLGRCLSHLGRRKNYRFALLLLNSDNFKAINDSLGHQLGDELLIAVARRLELLLRPGDTVARLGGDEYAILLEDLRDSRDALAIAERVHQELKPSFGLHGREVYLSASVGIAMSDSSYRSPDELLRDAETAMYQAKAGGPSRHLIFNPDMHRQALSRLEMEVELRKAVAAEAFEVHYQPVVNLKDQSLYGFEALLRWRHPSRGMIPPVNFIPLAEETGEILTLGRFVLREACKQWVQWRRPGKPDLTMNVNLSLAQLKDESFSQHLQQALDESGMPPESLQLEITESVLMDNPAATAAAFEKLKSLGIRLAIDDFGTGYSSLSYLHRFPVDTLKIDRSFTSRIDGLPENEAITSAVLAMGRTLKLAVVAEGVETAVQLQRLQEIGCELGQGYFFDRALAPDEAAKRLQ